MSDLMKTEMPNFIYVTTKALGKTGETIWVRARINPMSISSYYEAFEEVDGVIINVTAILVGGTAYLVKMDIEEVDEMMENIERGFSMKHEE